MTAGAWQTLDYDVVVVGAGAAGLRAAIEAAREGARTAIVCKSLLGKAGTVMAEDGIAAAAGGPDREDGWTSHFRDTVRGGRFVNDRRMAYHHSREAPDRLRELQAWGALFDSTQDGQLMRWQSAGHRYPRCAGRTGRTGLEVLRALQSQIARLGIDIHMECDVKRLIVGESRIAGAFGYWRTTGDFVLFSCGAIVLATGGVGRAWKAAAGPAEATGDGLALALDAGAQLVDMEFVQFQEAAQVCESALGGVSVDADSAASAVPGLFAAGGAAGGLHGAARLEGNSLSAALVFGRRAGMHAARYCLASKRAPAIDRAAIEEHRCALLTPFRCASGENPFLLLRELQECMSRFVGIARTGAGLENARTTIRALRGRWRNVAVSGGLAYNPGWHLALELDSLLWAAQATVLASSERKESRGSHRRSDFPEADERCQTTSVLISKSNDELVVDWRETWLASRRRSKSGVAMIAAAGSKSTA